MKKIVPLIISAILFVLMLPTMVYAADTANITLDLNGGTLQNGIPEGWEDLGGGQYRKAYTLNMWADFGDEWKGHEPVKDGFKFDDWDDNGYRRTSIFLKSDVTYSAGWLEYIDVVVDLNGGTISADQIPEGWTPVSGETGKYAKPYTAGDYSYGIQSEWDNVTPKRDGYAFVSWQCAWSYPSSENHTITATFGQLTDVTVDFQGFTVLSADSSWTKVSDSIYKKQYPEGASVWSISSELSSAFTVASQCGTSFFGKSFSCPDSAVKSGTTFTASVIPGYTLTFVCPENATTLVNNEAVTGTFDMLVSKAVFIQQKANTLVINDSQYSDSGKTKIEVIGGEGYALSAYTYNSGEMPSYISGISADVSFGATVVAGVQHYGVWFNGNEFDAEHLEYEDGKVKYNPATKVLSLDGINVTSLTPTLINYMTDITIDVISDSTIGSTAGSIAGSTSTYQAVIASAPYNQTFSATGDFSVKITGNGKLTINLGNSTVQYSSIFGILADELVADTDVDLILGDVGVSGYYSLTATLIGASKVTADGSVLKLSAGNLSGENSYPTFSGISGALVIKNNAEVSIAISSLTSPIGSPFIRFVGDGYSTKLDLIAGKIQINSCISGANISLAKPAGIISISGATEGAKPTDTTFTVASASEPLILVAEEITTDPTEEESIIDYSDGYLHYDKENAHVIMYAYPADPNDLKSIGDTPNKNIYIDLTDEAITTNFEIKYYSLDGGKKWKQVNQPLDSKAVSKWFSKSCTIYITDKYDSRTKKVTEDATVYYLGKTKKRPTLGNVKVNYKLARDDHALTNGQWILTDKSSGKVLKDLDAYEFMIKNDAGTGFSGNFTGLTNGQKGQTYATLTEFLAATNNEWGKWPAQGGVWVPSLTAAGKQQSAKIEVRIAAKDDSGNGFTPASKSKKVSVTSVLKVPNIKVNYSKETMKLKKNMMVFFGAETDIVRNADGSAVFKELPDPEKRLKYEDFAGTTHFSGNATGNDLTLDIQHYIGVERHSVLLWLAATDKKPASAKQTILLAARRVINTGTAEKPTCQNGKAKLPQGYEAYDAAKGKWKTSLASPTETTIVTVRIKATAKGGKETPEYTCFAASDNGYLVLFYGVYDTAKNKRGVVDAKIYATLEEAEAAVEAYSAN